MIIFRDGYKNIDLVLRVLISFSINLVYVYKFWLDTELKCTIFLHGDTEGVHSVQKYFSLSYENT
jgi:hypothetical protein